MTDMLKSAVAGLLVLGAASVTAAAGDWNHGAGSYKDVRGSAAVPVPAPTPIPVYSANWYLRLDAAYGFNSGGLSESGMLFGTEDTPGAAGPTPFGNRPAWFNDDFETFGTFGGGFGYYWSDRVRTDLTLEWRTHGEGTIDGEESWIAHFDNAGVWTPDPTRQINLYTLDETKQRSFFSLINAYYDLGKIRGVTPYVGVGVGIAYHELVRDHVSTQTECDPTTGCNAIVSSQTYRASGKSNTFTLAAAFNTGFAYSLSDITTLDVNYRLLYIDGADVRMNITDLSGNTFSSTTTIDATVEHQLRAGLRFDIN